MGTRAAAFTAKVRNLNDYHLRLLHGVVPPPSGLDIANTLKYFSQTLLGVLRDVQERPIDILRNPEQDDNRLALFPNLDYTALYQAVVSLVDIIPLVQYGTHVFGQALLHTLACLVVFLEREVIETLPYLVASTMTSVPESLHHQVIITLCYHILPYTVGIPGKGDDTENYAAASVPAVLMMIFQYSDNSAFHCELLECLMSLKNDVIRDLLCVIAHGTPGARPPAANLLFYYWPNLNPTLYDRRGVHIKFSGWKPLMCQIEECDGDGTSEASKICLDYAVCLSACPESPPPLYICLDCADEIKREHSSIEFFDILLPMAQVSATCENKNCRSNEKNAVATCFSLECASYNGNRPIRYCSQCNNIRHNNRRGIDHIVHTTIGSPWEMEPQMQSFLIEAIISLLNEAQPFGDKTKNKEHDRFKRAGLLDDVDQGEGLSPEERRLLSRYGVWLVIGLCAPNKDTPVEMLGRILAALCQWFNATQYLPDDQQGTAIERLKSEYIHDWLQEVCRSHFDVFVSCLMPHPLEYARVGGHWDTLSTRTDHIKEGFNRLFCLVPYEVISTQVWGQVMPNWMEAIHNDIPEEELMDLRITLSKLLDPEMSPLGFDATQMYSFISVRFENTTAAVQEQTLSWLQLLSSLSIVIPLTLIFSMFEDGIKALQAALGPAASAAGKKTSTNLQDQNVLKPVVEDDSRSSSPLSDNETHTSDHPEDNYTDRELHQTCLILMLDILYKQMEVQDSNKHQGVEGPVCVPVLRLIRNMLATTCMSPHSCDGDQECIMCELTITFFQLSTDILTYLCPLIAIQNNRVADIVPSDTESQYQGKGSDSSSQCPATPGGSQTPKHKEQSKGGEAEGASGRSSAANMPQIVTAKVETVGELDVAAMMPQEQVVKAVARAVTLTEEDVAKANAKASVAHPSVVGVDDKPVDLTQPAEDSSEYWVTSQGKFKIKLEELPNHLQVIHALLLRLETTEDGDVVYQMCLCLKLLILHGESLVQAASNNRGFLIWCQEHKTVELMWTLIEAEWSHVAEVCVQLLLHFITLPYGADMFWKLCETHFHHHDWKVRFQAVEKVVVVGRFLEVPSVRQCPGLQAALAHAFCFLLASLDDINVAVAQRASLYLQTIPDSGLKALCWCLEHQFDSVIVDRPMIIQALHQLSTRLPDRKILTWDFFFNRFDALYLEAQIALEKRGEIAYPKDLKNTDMTSDLFARKYTRAQDALTLVQSASVRTLSSSLGTKWPYKRTMSAPANMLNRADKQDYTIKGLCTVPCKLFEVYFIDMLRADGGMRCGEDSSVVQQLQRAMDLEGTDKDTLHLLVFLFMQFLAQPQHSGNEDKGSNLKVMNLVLRHVSVLMGFSHQERSFTIAPNRLRASPVFNAFLSNLPYVLDHNFKMGTSLLPTCLPVLQFCPAPHRMADLRYPSYSLWLLQPHPRHLWLVAVMTMLYKYKYGQPRDRQQQQQQQCGQEQSEKCVQVLSLIRIVLNTIDNHFHRCHKVEDPDQAMYAPNSAYSREVSQGSLGGGEEHLGETPPTSPGVFSGGRVTMSMGSHHSDSRVQYHADLKAPHITSNQEVSGSGECDEGEPELEAIPESPKTESPQQSCQESLYELEPLKQMVVAEQAVVRVQEDSSKAHISASPLVMGKDASVIKATKTQASQVTNIMASQLRAFDDSFYVSNKDKIDHYNRGETSKTRTGSDHSHSSWIIGGDDSEDSCSPETSSDTSTSLTSGCLAYIQPHPKVNQDAAIARAQNGCGSNDQGCSGMDEVFNPAQHLSPPSPLSMMDHMTLGSPVEVDGHTSTTVESPNTELTSPPDALELPTPERLLPVGGGEKPPAVKKVEENQSGSILERVWQAFGGWTSGSKAETQTDCDLVEVVSHHEGRTLSARESKGPTPTLKQISRTEQGSTSTEDTTETSNNTANSNGPQDICPGKAHGKSKGQRSSSSFTRSSKDKPSTDYTWADPSEPQSHQGGATCGSGPQQPSIKQSSLRVGEDCMTYRCMECGEIIEEFSNDDLGYCIIILSTFVHRQPVLAAPLLPRMLHTVAKVSGHEVFSWQYESNIHLPGSATSIGRQFLRCVLHQLAPNQIFNQIFQTHIDESQRVKLFKTLAQALTDFNELNPCAPIQLLLENLNSQKVLPTEKLGHILGNVACYMECVVFDGGTGLSIIVLPLFDAFLRKILFCTAALTDFNPLLRIMVALLRVPGVSSLKSILDPVSKLLSHALQNTPVKYEHLSDLCHLCNRAFSRERDKLLLARLVVYELVQALKFKTSIPDTNLVQLVQLVVQDCGGTLGSNSVVGDLPTQVSDIQNLQNTCVAECMRSHLPDALEFIADVHTLTKVKSNCRCSVGLNEDTLGGLVKAGIAQYLALEITRGNSRDNRAIMKYLPWLYSPPTTVQQGPKEFIDCVAHIRLLSWLLLGALTHTCLMGSTSSMSCHPIPPEASCHVADHIQVILAGFAEQSKASVLHMSSLFHAFILCQLWTVYLEQMAGSPGSDSFVSISAILTDFWAKVTPGVLQLVSHSKVDSEAAQLGEMVNLHFLSLMEALMECQSTVLTKLLPLWAPVLYTHHNKLPGQLAVRLQACQNAAPPTGADLDATTPNLLRWLHRLEFKMGQIELQSSTATQFYSV